MTAPALAAEETANVLGILRRLRPGKGRADVPGGAAWPPAAGQPRAIAGGDDRRSRADRPAAGGGLCAAAARGGMAADDVRPGGAAGLAGAAVHAMGLRAAGAGDARRGPADPLPRRAGPGGR